MKAARERMPWVDDLPQIYQGVINAALAGKPADMTITTHVCRGNFRSTWVSEGGYEPVAERLLGSSTTTATSSNTTATAPAASSRCGSCPRATRRWCSASSPPRAARWRARTTSSGGIDEATNYVDLEQCCLSPQCGFASTEEGNILAEERAMGEAAHDRGAGPGGVGVGCASRPPVVPAQAGPIRRVLSISRGVWVRLDGRFAALAGTTADVCIERLSRTVRLNQGQPPCNAPSPRFAPIMSAACCAPRRSRRRAPSASAARSAPTSSSAIEDREIAALIGKQEAVGLKSVTDGEFRRASWQTDFLGRARRRRVLRAASARC